MAGGRWLWTRMCPCQREKGERVNCLVWLVGRQPGLGVCLHGRAAPLLKVRREIFGVRAPPAVHHGRQAPSEKLLPRVFRAAAGSCVEGEALPPLKGILQRGLPVLQDPLLCRPAVLQQQPRLWREWQEESGRLPLGVSRSGDRLSSSSFPSAHHHLSDTRSDRGRCQYRGCAVPTDWEATSM